MASIIRSPDISDEKRKLTTRRARASVTAAVATSTPQPAPAQQAQATTPTPAAPKRNAEPDVGALIEQARQSVLEQFKAEGEKARELGRQRGLQEGRQSGAEESRKAFDDELARIRALGDQMQGALAAQIGGVEDIAVSIAFDAVCRVLGDTAVTREGIAALVQQAASHAVNTEQLVARLHPADLAALQSAGALDPALPSGKAVSWTADTAVVLGGCILETENGELDARLETQIDRLRTTLLAARRART